MNRWLAAWIRRRLEGWIGVIGSLLVGLLLPLLPADSIAADAMPADYPARLSYLEDATAGLNPARALERLRAEQGTTLPGTVFNLGQTRSRYWLRLVVRNPTAQTARLRLLTGAAYRTGLQVEKVDGERLQPLFSTGREQTYAERVSGFRYLHSPPFDLAPGESVELLMLYQTEGSSYLPLSVVDAAGFNQRVLHDSVRSALFYGFGLAAILVFALFGVAMADRNSLAFAALFLLGLLFVASMEGFAFKYLWPNAPAWNLLSPLVLQYALAALGLLVAAMAAAPGSSPAVRRAMRYLAAVCTGMVLLSPILPFVPMALLGGPLLALMFIAQGYAFLTWRDRDLRRNLVATLTALALAVAVAVLVVLSYDTQALAGQVYIQSTRLVFLAAVLAAIITSIVHVAGLRRDHARSIENELQASQREAEANKALFEAERRYARARALAGSYRDNLARASHDLLQPLTSLRSTIDAVAQDQSEPVRRQLSDAFDYLQNLCRQHLRETRPQPAAPTASPDSPAGPEAAPAEPATEAYSAGLVLDTAGRMFEREAADRGVILRHHGCSARISVPPVMVMRIVTNLVSNAIKHTDADRVVLGARRRAEAIRIQVIDAGPGLDPDALARLLQPYQRGPESAGHGLGLAICAQIAEQHGMQLRVESRAGHGTCCSLDIPLAN